MSKLICLCNGVREKELIEVIHGVDIASLEIIQNKTGAGTNCGRCINTIEAFLEKQESKHN
ncbi:(2Fe-2S)-binding protein [Carboxylicivirga mesophila]|uniref:(2Fe-2S)-binding protein n=1 Tax=Carboxylicivirga mesophila TaxID=1166478 RepID=A0ABS5K7F6_9BACT|nr:(2Fe-2S)-binding protein [Carboxylicivirga mesophila]MBS2210896.1 (2Fe-2S)-binding protein [Carboxylicivirga mesophila]